MVLRLSWTLYKVQLRQTVAESPQKLKVVHLVAGQIPPEPILNWVAAVGNFPGNGHDMLACPWTAVHPVFPRSAASLVERRFAFRFGVEYRQLLHARDTARQNEPGSGALAQRADQWDYWPDAAKQKERGFVPRSLHSGWTWNPRPAMGMARGSSVKPYVF